jgi:hypothetical protein
VRLLEDTGCDELSQRHDAHPRILLDSLLHDFEHRMRGDHNVLQLGWGHYAMPTRTKPVTERRRHQRIPLHSDIEVLETDPLLDDAAHPVLRNVRRKSVDYWRWGSTQDNRYVPR